MRKKIALAQTFPVACHTDYVGHGSTFVAINGFKQNGAAFIGDAIKKGATTLIVDQQENLARWHNLIECNAVEVKRVPNTRKALAIESARAAGFPTDKLTLIGITGTKGKTTTSFLLHALLQEAGIATALISTVENRIGTTVYKAPLTTPQPDYLHQFFKLCVEQNITHVVMEVAAQAITMHRIEGLLFDRIVLTNIEREHLEFYGSMERYVAAKIQLLNYLKPDGVAWLNKDDTRLTAIDHMQAQFFSLSQRTDCTAHNESDSLLKATLSYDDQNFMVSCPALYGSFNVANICAAAACALSLGIPSQKVQHALQTFQGIQGRYEKITLTNGARVIIDYAHNPLSFEQLLPVLRSQTDQLIVVFGAGGERDHGRRPIMGRIAAEHAHVVILTADNPRSENVENITNDILKGIHDTSYVYVEHDRHKALAKAYALSGSNAIIALLGKGPDEYQIIGDEKYSFSERSIMCALDSSVQR